MDNGHLTRRRLLAQIPAAGAALALPAVAIAAEPIPPIETPAQRERRLLHELLEAHADLWGANGGCAFVRGKLMVVGLGSDVSGEGDYSIAYQSPLGTEPPRGLSLVEESAQSLTESWRREREGA